ncbi:stage III sporulation protein SpoIIIAB [Bacillus badius]|uniref:Stage III sporulation protein AB n=1 Tax=Bacillus badius TaxID=1455 RepID=A0ABR5AYI7_BACBA|nr:stage III sporulation protein SpoIIIAB [Bacillus badius]KIL75264.1 Stage III sporulation protein AB [Bacillus badius]KIL79749.1 Stage III sporulation protein AB [Bacillus badius]KZR60350.1 stage III sporulation protein SpoAB [Bacillus badius]MED4715166.1 stage III sporulation protein SpoIIIAB [Bacillus badius]
MKWLGALLILFASVWLGAEQSKKLSDRPKQIRFIRSALQTLEAEIVYGLTPLHESARKLSERLPPPVSELFALFSELLTSTELDASEAWKRSLAKVWPRTALMESERAILLEFGETVGKHDRLTEQKQILVTLKHLERQEEEACEKQKKYGKMMRSLSLMGGLLIVLLLF